MRYDHVVWSDELYEILGCDDRETRRRMENILDYIHVDDREILMEVIEKSRSSKINPPAECRVVTPAGLVRSVFASASEIKNEQGETIALYGIIQDISDLKRVEEEIFDSAQVLSQVHEAVITTDFEGHITSWNRGAQDLFGLSSASAQGENVRLFMDQADFKALAAQHVPALMTSGLEKLEIQLKNAFGQRFTAMLSLSLKKTSAASRSV
ncbi:MAG: PAS domain S-box protein [Verrucomicrobiae bacterium]|nr:PAS domain S-box protein [Verrucomicrobiae bacterium]